MNAFDHTLFKNPTAQYASAYAWVWDTEITKEGIDRGLAMLKSAGIGAVYVIPEPKAFRPQTVDADMKPEYLSDEYFEIFKYFTQKAKSMGFAAWLYDEGGWPSGSACKKITKMHPELGRHRAAAIEIPLAKGMTYTPPENHESFLAAFTKAQDGTFTRIRGPIVCDGVSKVFEYRYIRVAFRVDHDEEFDTDIMNPETTRLFLELTHERYKKFLGEDFGTYYTYIFDDEAAVEPDGWTRGFEDMFFEEYGYDILDYLPQISYRAPAVTEKEKLAMADRRRLVSKLVNQNFFKPIQDWCHENGIMAIGHVDNDHDLESMILRLPCYARPLEALRLFDVPGVDVIYRHIYPEGLSTQRVEYSVPFFPRFASSAAAQVGTGLALTESLACYGEGTTPEIMRYVFGAQAVRGINVFNCNSLHYSHPKIRPLFTDVRPGFEHLNAINKYLSRLAYLARLGTAEVKNALYMPCENVCRGENADAFHALGVELEKQGCSFDLIDDDFVRRAEINNGRLSMGLAAYEKVLIPEGALVPEDVSQKLAPFISSRATPVASVENENFRLSKRNLPDGATLYLVFNEDCRVQKGDIRFAENRPAYRLWIEDGRVEPFEATSLTLDFGETAAILFSGTAPDGVEPALFPVDVRPVLCGFTLAKTAELFIDRTGAHKDNVLSPQGIPAECGPWEKYFGRDFSGEASYSGEFELDGEFLGGDFYELDLGTVENTASVRLNGTDIGIASLPPFVLRFSGELLREKNSLEICVANTSCNRINVTDVYSLFDHKHCDGHQLSATFEREVNGGGLKGPLTLKKLS
ncbi:MAG: hypothetical protein IJY86_04635 [Clostridia bacterium]|nr:hypothetical protein [Clostridia bacterium]